MPGCERATELGVSLYSVSLIVIVLTGEDEADELEVEGNGVEKESSDISAGSSGTLKVTLTKNGSYEIYCPVDGHKGLGMKGTVTVGGAGAAGGTSTEDMHTETSGTTTNSTGY